VPIKHNPKSQSRTKTTEENTDHFSRNLSSASASIRLPATLWLHAEGPFCVQAFLGVDSAAFSGAVMHQILSVLQSFWQSQQEEAVEQVHPNLALLIHFNQEHIT
jgi:hypothetical protein